MVWDIYERMKEKRKKKRREREKKTSVPFGVGPRASPAGKEPVTLLVSVYTTGPYAVSADQT